VPHYRIAPPPEKSPPADNLPAKIRLAVLLVNCRLGETFSGGRQSCNEEIFYGAGDILIRGRRISFVIVSPRADFSWGTFYCDTVVESVTVLYEQQYSAGAASGAIRLQMLASLTPALISIH